MSIVFGCDSFLSLRNVRNGELGRRLEDQRVKVLVDPNQYEGSRAVCPTGVELECLLDFDPYADPQLSSLLKQSYYTRKCYYDPGSFWIKLRASSDRNGSRLRRAASLTKARYSLATHWVSGSLGMASSRRRNFVQALRRHPVVARYRKLLADWDASAVVGLSLR